jgi:hypothetical protein
MIEEKATWVCAVSGVTKAKKSEEIRKVGTGYPRSPRNKSFLEGCSRNVCGRKE